MTESQPLPPIRWGSGGAGPRNRLIALGMALVLLLAAVGAAATSMVALFGGPRLDAQGRAAIAEALDVVDPGQVQVRRTAGSGSCLLVEVIGPLAATVSLDGRAGQWVVAEVYQEDLDDIDPGHLDPGTCRAPGGWLTPVRGVRAAVPVLG